MSDSNVHNAGRASAPVGQVPKEHHPHIKKITLEPDAEGNVAEVELTKNEEVKFYFRKDAATDTKRPNVYVVIPFLTISGLINELNTGDQKVQDFILELVNDSIHGAAREQVNDETHPVNKQQDLNLEKLTLAYLANVPKSQRRGIGIDKETWDAFAADYIAVMPGITGKTVVSVTNAANLFTAKLNPARGKKKVLEVLKDQLDLWMTNTTQLEQFETVAAFLSDRIKSMLSEDEATTLESL